MAGGLLGSPIPGIWALYAYLTTWSHNSASKAGSYQGIISNNLQLIQQQMDAFSIDIDNAITDATNNNQQSRLKTLFKLQKTTMNEFSNQLQNNMQILQDSVNKGYITYEDLKNAQNTALDNAYKGTAQETQAATVKELINNAPATDISKIFIREALSNKSFDLSAFQSFYNNFANIPEMIDKLGNITKKFGGTLASQFATEIGRAHV